ncbi:portal protein [Novosphingobium sp. BL-52-GroH]|uniref:portal protein n=1 Tax=Novosphingobium sp. BL-52-GroH TaxID=3349877 RepID=UPI0038511EB6
MNEQIQDEELAKADLRDHERLKSLRSPWESTWHEVDERFPNGAGGFNKSSPGQLRGARNFDTTHITANKRFAAAGVAITTPEEKDYINVRFLDDDLMAIRAVQLWCERASRRMYGIRHAARTGFGTAANEDWDQLGRYGTSPVFVDGKPGRGMSYRALHLSEVYIDVDYAGLVDTVHRCYKRSARQLEQEFGMDALTPKMREALNAPGKENTEFEILHIVAPNRAWDREKLDWRRMPIVSRYLAMEEKTYIRRAGFFTMPIAVSRHTTSAGEIYGRSPAIDVMSTINGVNAMRNTVLRAAHKAVDPALLFNNDAGVTKLVTRASGLNPGLVDDMGRPMVARMPGGENGIPIAVEMIEQERQPIRTEFLEDFYRILTDPNSRMTTTEVLEVMAKQGILVRPFASQYATEKQGPMSQRELDLAIRNGQLEEFPAEVIEAGAWPMVEYENMLAKMARAEGTSSTLRFVEALPILAQFDPKVVNRVNTGAIAIGLAKEMGVRPSYLRSDEEVAAIEAKQEEQKMAMLQAEQLQQGSQAVLNLSKANQLSEAA